MQQKCNQTLINALDDHDINIAASAADGLGEVGDEKHVSILQKYISAEVWMKCAVLRGMGKIGGFKALEAILPLMNDKDTLVKISSIKALGQIGNIKALPRLFETIRRELLRIYGSDLLDSIYNICTKNNSLDFTEFGTSENIIPLVKLSQTGSIEDRIKSINILGFLLIEFT